MSYLKIKNIAVLILRFILKLTTWSSRISFKLNIILAGLLLWQRDMYEVVKAVNLLIHKYGTKFSSEHYIWKSHRSCGYYGRVMYSSALFVDNYNITYGSDPEKALSAPSWETVSNFFMEATQYSVKVNNKTVNQLTHSHLFWIEELKTKKDNNGALLALKNLLTAHSVDLSDIFISDLLANLESYFLHKQSAAYILDKFKDNIQKNNPVYSATTWMCLYNILIFNGLLQSGFIARNKGIEQLFIEAEAEPDNTAKNELAFLAAFEKGEYSLAEDLLKQLKGKIPLKKYKNLQAYYFLLTGNINDARKIWDADLTKSDKIFANYFENKKVAIVGPAPTGLNTGSEIDSYDVVIRTNYMGANASLPQDEFGKKTNVSLYAATFLKMKREEPKQFVKDLDCYFVKHKFKGFVSTDFKRRKAKILIKNKMFFIKKPNAIPCILFDVLHYKTSKIKVFHTNFFLSEKPYHENYSGISSKISSSKLQNPLGLLTYHDLISQISFMRNLWKKELIEVDENCADILSMSDEIYMEGMEKLF